MATTTSPEQTRNIDPFANYGSDVVSRLTRIVTRGNDSVHSPHALDVIEDSTSPLDTVVITTGELFKDDIMITVDENFRVDMSDSDFYETGPALNENGYYWILARYVYQKSRPAPTMRIRILKPSQTGSFDSSTHVFLKAVRVTLDGTFQIVSFHDVDPTDMSGNGKRVYTQLYPGMENSIPSTFTQDTDEGRLIYVRDKSSMYFGTQSKFEIVDSVRDIIDTTSCDAGDLAYVATDGKCYQAQADSTSTLARCCILEVGLESDGSGKIKTSGRVDRVPVELGIDFEVGDDCYLSVTEAGRVNKCKICS